MCFLVNVYSLVLVPKESRGFTRIGDMKNEAEHPVSTFLERRIKPQPTLLSRRMTAGALAAGGAWDPQVSGVRVGGGVLAAAFQSGSPHLAGHCPLEATESRLQLGEQGTWPRLEVRISYRQTPKVCVNRIISRLRPLQVRMLRPGRLNELPGFLCRTGPRTQVS